LDAAFNLGQAYRLGRGVPTDLAAAQRWLSQAAGGGHTDAQTTLGLLLFDSGDRASGVRWLKLAAEAGEPRALLMLGTALFNGDGVPKDRVLGYAYVSRAAAQGLAPARTTLKEMNGLIPVSQRQKGVAVARAAASKPKPSRSPVAPAGPSKAMAAQGGGWRIQLGAFSKRSSAQGLFDRLSPALGGKIANYVSAGAITRLQVGPYQSRAAAASACAVLKGQACFPVPAK